MSKFVNCKDGHEYEVYAVFTGRIEEYARRTPTSTWRPVHVGHTKCARDAFDVFVEGELISAWPEEAYW